MSDRSMCLIHAEQLQPTYIYDLLSLHQRWISLFTCHAIHGEKYRLLARLSPWILHVHCWLYRTCSRQEVLCSAPTSRIYCHQLFQSSWHDDSPWQSGCSKTIVHKRPQHKRHCAMERSFRRGGQACSCCYSSFRLVSITIASVEKFQLTSFQLPNFLGYLRRRFS